MMVELITPEWPAPKNVQALFTTRLGGVSRAPYDSLNLGAHVGDDRQRVSSNRLLLGSYAGLPSVPHWLEQVHGCEVVHCDTERTPVEADAATTKRPGRVCAVMTADCLPLLLCNRSGTRVAAVHAGWRGLAAGVIEAALAQFEEPGGEVLAWLGPAIGPDAFEVGEEVREAFLRVDPLTEPGFKRNRPGHWLADIYFLARKRLSSLQVGYIGGGDYCTFTDATRFFSYRRDGVTGRMAALIWLTA